MSVERYSLETPPEQALEILRALAEELPLELRAAFEEVCNAPTEAERQAAAWSFVQRVKDRPTSVRLR